MFISDEKMIEDLMMLFFGQGIDPIQIINELREMVETHHKQISIGSFADDKMSLVLTEPQMIWLATIFTTGAKITLTHMQTCLGKLTNQTERTDSAESQ